MNLPVEALLAKLDDIKGYKALFDRAYPGEGISKSTISKALANFERTVISAEAPFDRWVNGNETAISDSAKRGFVLFNEKALCVKCHNTWRFTDDGFHDIGVPGDDLGRGKIMPDFDSMRYAFKTPTLRNGGLRGPFMHDGSESTLAAVVDLYNLGGRTKRPSLSEHVKPLGLTTVEKADLIEFIQTLTSADKPVAAPLLPR
jgi:cytochrome c peroxidase